MRAPGDVAHAVIREERQRVAPEGDVLGALPVEPPGERARVGSAVVVADQVPSTSRRILNTPTRLRAETLIGSGPL